MKDDATHQFVRTRAGNLCEYCHLSQSGHEERFSIDHVIARKHGGTSDTENLALSCLRCNLFKGTDLASVDPLTGGVVVRLFNPRVDQWDSHFFKAGALINGITPTGRATVALLKMNAPERVQLRQALKH